MWFHKVLVDILLSNNLYLTAELPVTKQKLFTLLGVCVHKALFTSRIIQTAVSVGIDCCSYVRIVKSM